MNTSELAATLDLLAQALRLLPAQPGQAPGVAAPALAVASQKTLAEWLDVHEQQLRERPDNASLIELRVYRAAGDGFATVQAACGGSLERMLAAGKRLGRADFTKDLEDDLGRVLRHMADLCR